MQQRHTTFWIKYLHNVRVWKCALPHQDIKEFASEDALLDKHMRAEHPGLAEATIKSMARNGGVPLPRRIDICPICGDEHRPQRRMDEMWDKHDSESEAEYETSVKATPEPNHTKAAKSSVHFAELEEITHQAFDNADDALASESKDGRLSADTLAHRRMERYIGKHLKALTFFFARSLIEEDDDEEETSAGRGRSLDDLKSVNLTDLEDPPKLPHAGNERMIILHEFEGRSSNIYSGDDNSYTRSPDDLARIVQLAHSASKPEPVAWRNGDLSRESNVLVFGHEALRHTMNIPADSDVDGEITIGTLRVLAASKLGVDDLSRISMFFEGRILKNDDDDHETARSIGFRVEGVWKEILCVVDKGPANTRMYNDFHTDRNVIVSNRVELEKYRFRSESGFDWKMFWEDDWLQQIFLRHPRVHLREAVEVWRGIEPTMAYAVAADILIFLELCHRRNMDKNSPGGAGVDKTLSAMLTAITTRTWLNENLEEAWSPYSKVDSNLPIVFSPAITYIGI